MEKIKTIYEIDIDRFNIACNELFDSGYFMLHFQYTFSDAKWNNESDSSPHCYVAVFQLKKEYYDKEGDS